MDEEDLISVPRTIRDYVNLMGGKVSLESLESDFHKAYKTSIPFDELGYPDLYSFLFCIRGIRVVELNGGSYLISNTRKKTPSVVTNGESDDVSNLSVQLTNNLVFDEDTCKRKVTVKSCTGQANMNARKSIIEKMSLYSSSSSESAVSEVNDAQNSETYSQKYTEPESQTYQDYHYYPNLELDSNVSSSFNQGAFNSPNIFNNNEYFAPPTTSVDTPNSNALPSYANNPYYLLLLDLVGKHSLAFPVFETLTSVASDNEGISFNTILRIGNDNFISPSYNDLSLTSIHENLIKTAYESLKHKYEFSFVNAQHNVITSILEIINSHKHGISTEYIKAAYIQKYKIPPPIDWINSIENTNSVYIEPLSTQVIIHPYRAFLSPTPYSNSLPAQIFPASEPWNIFISNCVNTNAIWFRILDEDYEIRYVVLLTEMNKHYDRNVLSDVKTVNVGELYACCFEHNWYRAEVLSAGENFAECRLIDMGIKKEFLLRSLFPLNHKFANTPPLAFRCSMAGLTKYENTNYVSCQLMKMLNNEIAIGKLNYETSNNQLSMDIYLRNNVFNVSVNKYFLNKIRNELHVPKIAQVGEAFDVHLLAVDECGEARVQVESGSLQLLKHALDCAAKLIAEDGNKRSFYSSSHLKLNLEKIYLIQTEKSWKRIMVKTLLSENKANVQYIDTGDFKVVDTRNIVHTDSLPDTLIHISPQCQTVRISIQNDTTQKIISFMNRIRSQTDLQSAAFTVKVIKTEKYPIVQLYKKQNNDEVVPIKDIFLEKCDQVTSINFVNNLCNILPDNLCFDLFNNVSSSKVIPKYQLNKGSIYKVVVLKALSPSNFILKIENIPKFAEFMLDLNNYHSLFSPPSVSKVTIGQCYAVQLENNIWYRGLALYVMEDLKTVVVRLVDFAETVSVPITAVYNTLPEFYALPVQTVNAKLFNVKPIRGEWTQQDCYRFKEIVYQKVLNCIIVDFSNTFCKVILLDDSNHNEMINATNVLLNERRAVLEDIKG
ncbi:uncharacterized protein LOC135835934 [Planococcus citri]|uniref:uncharacterized protein LOC135835934 n=1 Tax=Planococcus citri TaxID=170843 RepID=UPI0031F89A63